MAFKVRQSKFRHLFGELPRETYNDIKCSRKATEGAGIEGNEKRLALPWDAARQVLVLENSKHGRVEHSAPKLNNTAPVLDFKFSPFSAEQLTTGGEDGTVRVFEIPEDGLTKTEDPSAELTGHLKPVVCLDYHPCVEGLLATASKDQTVRIWDLEEQNEMAKFDMPEEVTNVQSLQWRYDGSLLGLACKDKISRIFDPRQASAVLEIKVTESTRPTKFCWAGQDRFISTGFSTNMDREFFLWDIRNPAKFLHEQKVDKASGALMPWYDAPHGLLFLAAKGDGNVRYYEITNDDKVHYITDNRSTKSIKAFNFVSRRALDTTVCETHRALKLEGTLVQPISFRVPRKSTEFQEDLFPDMLSNEPALEIKDWCKGQNAPPKLESMRPGAHAPKKRKITLKEENRLLKQRVDELEEENARLKAKLGMNPRDTSFQPPAASPPPTIKEEGGMSTGLTGRVKAAGIKDFGIGAKWTKSISKPSSPVAESSGRPSSEVAASSAASVSRPKGFESPVSTVRDSGNSKYEWPPKKK